MRTALFHAVWFTSLSVAVCTLAACTMEAGALSKDVGGPCENDEGCNVDSECQEGELYPDGMCTIDCESQSECILSTVCARRGHCLMVCGIASDCRDGYDCVEEDLVGGGTRKVCANQTEF